MNDKTNKNLKEAGLKATLPRIKILEILQRTSGTDDHFTAEDIYKELIINNYDVGLATVYRVLTQFENAGIVVKHQFDVNKSVYEINDPQHHDHMVCVDTGEITEFNDEVIKKKQREIAAKHGYELLDQSLVLYVKKIKKTYVYTPRLSDTRNPFYLYRAFKILKDNNIPVLTHFQALNLCDYIDTIRFFFLYPSSFFLLPKSLQCVSY